MHELPKTCHIPCIIDDSHMEGIVLLRIAIVEDEDSYRKILAHFCATFSEEKGEEVTSVCFQDGFRFLETYRGNFDAVLMDICMPLMDGMECARKLRQLDEHVPIIFITNMAQYAIRGYEVEAMGFMLKPVQYEEFVMKLERIQRRLRSRAVCPYAIMQKNGTRVVDIQNIQYVEVLNHDLIFHTRDGVFQTYGKLSALAEDSRFSGFIKVSQSHLVNCAYVENIGKTTLEVAGDQVPLSRRRRTECLEKMARIMGGKLS